MTTTAPLPEQHLYLLDASYAQVRTISEWPSTAPISLTWHCMAMPQCLPAKQFVAVLNHTPEFRPPPTSKRGLLPVPRNRQVKVKAASISVEDIPPEPKPPKAHVRVTTASVSVADVPPEPEPPKMQVRVPNASISFEDSPPEPEPPNTHVQVLAASICVEEVPPEPEPLKMQVQVPSASISFEDTPPEPEPPKAQVQVPAASFSFEDVPPEPEPPKEQVRVPAASFSFEDVPPEPEPPKEQVRVPTASISFEDVPPEPEPPKEQVRVLSASISFEDVPLEPEPPKAHVQVPTASVNVEHEPAMLKTPEEPNTHVLVPAASISVEEHHAILQSFEARNIFTNRTYDGDAFQQLDREISPVSHSNSESDRITAEIDTIQLEREESSSKHDDVVQNASDVSGKGCDSDESDYRSKEDVSEVVDVEELQEQEAPLCKSSSTVEEMYTPAKPTSYEEQIEYVTGNYLEGSASDDHCLLRLKEADCSLKVPIRNGIQNEFTNAAVRKAHVDGDTSGKTEISQEISIQKERDELEISHSEPVEEWSRGHEIKPPSSLLKMVGNAKSFSEHLEKDLTSLTDTDEFLLWSSNTEGGDFEEDRPESSQLQPSGNVDSEPIINRNVNFLLAKVKCLETEIDDARFSANQTQQLVMELQSKLESSTKVCRDLLATVQE